MDNLRVGWLIELFKSFRAGDGLTTDKLRKEHEFILLLGVQTAEDAKDELEAIVLGMGDGFQARAVRNSLVISNGTDGIEARGGPEIRRKWATGQDTSGKPESDLLIPRSITSHVIYERKGFEELAKLILDRETKRTESRSPVVDTFQQALRDQDEQLDSAPGSKQVTSTLSTPRRFRFRKSSDGTTCLEWTVSLVVYSFYVFIAIMWLWLVVDLIRGFT
ncbi:hypothetical protein QF026_004793 [Streptomyces aurantiacus]|uniref:hypothetical protein n=1 Tax=Streptomyces aurantiacus TaxID=47760 RepID=UPI002794C9E9|nr:hypothetical protein [Streptomyces aurantiacus]MDQ0776327.1 hypothetical protein [Streptomyces aurantiacus]